MQKVSTISAQAIAHIKEHKKELITCFAGDSYPSLTPETVPLTIFMAGSPGAGKTEFSKGLIQEFRSKPVRIDADEIREFIPCYTGKNSNLIQGAASIGVEKIFDHVMKKRMNVIVDGTFMNAEKSMSNIKRALEKGRKVEIYYIYQKPLLAWEFTQARESVEGRYIPQEAFIDALIKARQNVNEAKKVFKANIELHVVVKNIDVRLHRTYLNVNTVDDVLKSEYDKIQLENLLNPSS